MKKILGLLITLFLLNGCAESVALLGTGASNGKIVQSSFNSVISYGVKNKLEKPLLGMPLHMQRKTILRKKRNLVYHLLKKLTQKFVLY